MVGINVIKALQTNLRSSYIERPTQKYELKIEAPKQHYILIVGFSRATSNTLLPAVSGELEIAVADDESKALELLRSGFKENKICDLVVLSEQIKNPYEVGALADILRSRSMCGEVAVINPIDELRARKLGMMPVNNVPDIIRYLTSKDKENYLSRATTQKTHPSHPSTTPKLEAINGLAASLQTFD